jgi:hypothetical protein
MYLLTLAILSAALGYFLALGRFGGLLSRLALRLRRQDAFRQWALGRSARWWPADFKHWLAGLSESEAADFHHALDEYANSLGFQLDRIIDGGLDNDPRMRQVFVEAVVVYSPAYRKVRQAQQAAAEKPEQAEQPETPSEPTGGNGHSPRAANRNGNKETPEAAAAD